MCANSAELSRTQSYWDEERALKTLKETYADTSAAVASQLRAILKTLNIPILPEEKHIKNVISGRFASWLAGDCKIDTHNSKTESVPAPTSV